MMTDNIMLFHLNLFEYITEIKGPGTVKGQA